MDSKKVNEIFQKHEGVDMIYTTSDNTPFYIPNSAENHAKTLKDKKVEKHTRPVELTVEGLDVKKGTKDD